MSYIRKIDLEWDDIYTIQEFKDLCKMNICNFDSGSANPIKDNLIDPSITIEADDHSNIPLDATHVVWYNK